MLVDFRKPILDMQGEPIIWRAAQVDPSGKVTKPVQILTMLFACQEALGAAFPDESNTLSQVDKTKRFLLGLRIAEPIPPDISIEEAADIMRLVSKTFGGSVVYPRVAEIFEAATKAAEKKPDIKSVA